MQSYVHIFIFRESKVIAYIHMMFVGNKHGLFCIGEQRVLYLHFISMLTKVFLIKAIYMFIYTLPGAV